MARGTRTVSWAGIDLYRILVWGVCEVQIIAVRCRKLCEATLELALDPHSVYIDLGVGSVRVSIVP
jgi:hypothetical protein